LFLKGAQAQNFRLAQKHLEKSEIPGVVIEDSSMSELFQTLHNTFLNIIAGGGVITNPDDEILMIHRNGKWDLPKGKIDSGESIKECAQREVMEETGITSVTVGKEIWKSYHIYESGSNATLKITHWFEMKTDKKSKLFPQVEENITDARWIDPAKLNLYLIESYETIKDVLKAANKL